MATSATPGPEARRVFISYARKDGVATAQQLRDVLCAHGLDVWLDTDRIEGGRSWSRELEDALNRCHILIAILSEGSSVSDICRAEQTWALEEGKLVIPVLATPKAPRPIYLRTLQYRKVPEQEQELLRDLRADLPAVNRLTRPRRNDTIPPLPENLIPRQKAIDKLREILFTESEETNIAVTAVAGMGAIGKTVLASALCNDPVVQRAFPDGIAWITLGREWNGDSATAMQKLATALGADLKNYTDPIVCRNHYEELLQDKTALIVIDDVWERKHLKSFEVNAARSRLLFTTREEGIARVITKRRYSADLLDEDEARELLARSAATIVEKLPPAATGILQACGGLAGALAQFGASLRDLTPVEWDDALDALRKVDLSALKDRLDLSGQTNFFSSLAASIEAIPDERMRQRYLKLAVLLEDVPAPLAILKTLWAVDESEGRRLARYFVDRSLATWQSADDPKQGIKLHDLQLDYVRARHPNREALQLIHEATRLSAHVIQADPRQFASQMVGRLVGFKDAAEIPKFLGELAAAAPRPSILPQHPALHPPGTALVRKLEGHSNWVTGVAVSANGRSAISASLDKTLRVWDLETGRPLRTLKGHSDGVNAVALSSNGHHAVSASLDKALRVWDLETGRPLRILEGHSSSVTGVALTADGRRAVSASLDKTLRVWDLETGRPLRTLEGHSDGVNAVALSSNGHHAISASLDNTLKVWDLDSRRPPRTLEGHSSSVTGVALTADGRRAVSASRDNTLKVWDLDSGRELLTLEGHSDGVNAVALSSNGHHAVSASLDKTVRVWDLETGREVHLLKGYSHPVMAVALTRDGRRAVSASRDNAVKVWDLEIGRELLTPDGHSGWVTGVAVSADGRRAVSASEDKTLKVWDPETGRELRTLRGHRDVVTCVAMAPDGRLAVSGSCDHTLRVWDLEHGRKPRLLQGHYDVVTCVAMTPDGRRAVSGSRNGTLKVWDLKIGGELRSLNAHPTWVSGIAVTPDGRHAVSGSRDKTLKVWDLQTGRAVCKLKGHSRGVTGVAMSHDGRRALSSSADTTLKVWDLENLRELKTLPGHSLLVNGVALSPNGLRAVSVSYDDMLKVWDLQTGAVLAIFTADAAPLCCTFPSDRTIVAGDQVGHLHFLALEE